MCIKTNSEPQKHDSASNNQYYILKSWLWSFPLTRQTFVYRVAYTHVQQLSSYLSSTVQLRDANRKV